MGWESSGVVRFNLGPLLQGHKRIVSSFGLGEGELAGTKPRGVTKLLLFQTSQK